MTLNSVGVMQGRLSPRPTSRLQAFPWDHWKQEFGLARDAGFDSIEWIFEAERARQNPLWTAPGQRAIAQQVNSTGVRVLSVCADYFMVHRLAGGSREDVRKNVSVLKQLIVRSAEIGARRILLPLLEQAGLHTPEIEEEAVDSIRQCLPIAEHYRVTLGLEMEIEGRDYADFIGRFDSPRVRAYYDTGNSTAAGFDIAEDVRPVLPLLEAVHVKDREVSGTTRNLGTGAANFEGFFRVLDDYGFRGDYVMQSYFGSDHLYDTLRNFNYLKVQLARAKREAA